MKPTELSTHQTRVAKPKTVLLADDNDQVRNLIRQALECETHFKICAEATTGTEAVEKAKALAPDLIILDVSMPGLNGLEVAGILRYSLPKIQIVMVTMYAEDISQHFASTFQIDAVFPKSEGLEKLTKHVQSLLADEPKHDEGSTGRLKSFNRTAR